MSKTSKIFELIKNHEDISILATKETVLEVCELLKETKFRIEDTFVESVNYPHNLESAVLLYVSRIDNTIIMEKAIGGKYGGLIYNEAEFVAVEPIIFQDFNYDEIADEVVEKLVGKFIKLN